ncbi:MAG: hypothetical protein JSS81_17760 [Acidobacteria bacterium]|nr:hypothetical protein [Acidobacteriota bacterium]
MKLFSILSLLFLILVFSHDSAAQSKTRVRFARGATSATLSGTIKGYAYRDYTFSAKPGQQLSVRLSSKNASLEIVVRNPAGENLNSGGTTWNDEIASTGTYLVRVLLPRAAARRRESAAFRLTIEIE